VAAVVRAGNRAVFYRTTSDLGIDYEHVEQQLSTGVAAIIVINYFGFPADIEPLMQMRRAHDFVLIEDWAHSFVRGNALRLTGDRGDAAVYSFAKLVPMYAGGGLRINTHREWRLESLERVPVSHALVGLKRLSEQLTQNAPDGRLRAMLLGLEEWRASRRRQRGSGADSGGASGGGDYVLAAELASSRMSWFSRMILARTDVRALVAVRQRNYRLIASHLPSGPALRPVRPDCPETVCPWAFPVILQDRVTQDRVLRRAGVPVFTFGESLHSAMSECEADVAAEARELSRTLLLIPVHQNLTEADVLRFCSTVRNVLRPGVNGERRSR
jgi:perosamine synthetase